MHTQVVSVSQHAGWFGAPCCRSTLPDQFFPRIFYGFPIDLHGFSVDFHGFLFGRAPGLQVSNMHEIHGDPASMAWWGRHASAVHLLQIAYVCFATKPYCRPPRLAVGVFESWVAPARGLSRAPSVGAAMSTFPDAASTCSSVAACRQRVAECVHRD